MSEQWHASRKKAPASGQGFSFNRSSSGARSSRAGLGWPGRNLFPAHVGGTPLRAKGRGGHAPGLQGGDGGAGGEGALPGIGGDLRSSSPTLAGSWGFLLLLPREDGGAEVEEGLRFFRRVGGSGPKGGCGGDGGRPFPEIGVEVEEVRNLREGERWWASWASWKGRDGAGSCGSTASWTSAGGGEVISPSPPAPSSPWPSPPPPPPPP